MRGAKTMKKGLSNVLILLLILSVLPEISVQAMDDQDEQLSLSQVEFQNDFRRLWIDHVLWTSNYITSATTAGAEDQEQVLARLLKNQEDIGNAIKPIYGDEAGNKLTDLLTEHIEIAGQLVNAAINNENNVDELNREWYRNADDIAAFLSEANPNLSEEKLDEFLEKHLELVTDDLVASIEKDWDARIESIDEGVTHIIMMADAISEAVVKQFPENF